MFSFCSRKSTAALSQIEFDHHVHDMFRGAVWRDDGVCRPSSANLRAKGRRLIAATPAGGFLRGALNVSTSAARRYSRRRRFASSPLVGSCSFRLVGPDAAARKIENGEPIRYNAEALHHADVV